MDDNGRTRARSSAVRYLATDTELDLEGEELERSRATHGSRGLSLLSAMLDPTAWTHVDIVSSQEAGPSAPLIVSPSRKGKEREISLHNRHAAQNLRPRPAAFDARGGPLVSQVPPSSHRPSSLSSSVDDVTRAQGKTNKGNLDAHWAGLDGGGLEAGSERGKPARRRKRKRHKGFDWNGDWSMLGVCFDFLDEPHSNMSTDWTLVALPSTSIIKRFPSDHITLFPLPPSILSASISPPYDPLTIRLGLRRAKWIIPVHGPILNLPNRAVVSDGCLFEGEDALAVLARRLSRPLASFPFEPDDDEGDETSPSPPSSSPAPRQVTWSASLLCSFRNLMDQLIRRGALGPCSYTLHRSSLASNDDSADERVLIGDHWRVHVDLAHAFHLRWVLDQMPCRFEPAPTAEDKVSGKTLLLRGCRLALFDDEDRLVCTA